MKKNNGTTGLTGATGFDSLLEKAGNIFSSRLSNTRKSNRKASEVVSRGPKKWRQELTKPKELVGYVDINHKTYEVYLVYYKPSNHSRDCLVDLRNVLFEDLRSYSFATRYTTKKSWLSIFREDQKIAKALEPYKGDDVFAYFGLESIYKDKEMTIPYGNKDVESKII